MSTVLCNDYAGRQLISDIAPIEGVETPYTITSGNFWGETATVDNPILIYRSAFGKYYASAENDYCMVVAFFDSEPTLSGRYGDSATKVNYSGNYWYVNFSRSHRGSEATSDIITFNTLESWKEYIFSPMQPPITYNWQSVPSIIGKNGISLLSIIKNSAINSGDAVSGATTNAFDRLEESTKISTLIQGISEETPIIYSDDVNYMSITPTVNNTCTLKFYLHGNVIYTLTDVSINAYLSFLIDEANGIMKPSIIYEDS